MAANENRESEPLPLLLERWRSTLHTRNGDPAIYAPDREVLRTFSDIEAESAAFENRLEGYPPLSVVAIQIGNHPSWPALLIACLRLRLIPLPLGRHIEAGELGAALKTCSVACLVEAVQNATVISGALPRAGSRSFSQPPPKFLKLTSGTTAAPRAIRFQTRQLVADCDNICDTMGIASSDLNFGVIPFSHSYGFSNLITPLLCRGVPLAASEDRLPRAILSDLRRSGATVFPGMPVFYQAFAEMEDIPALPFLRLCISAGAPLSKYTGRGFTEKFHLKIHSFYGASECGGIAYDASESLDYEDHFVGQPMRNVQITLLDDADPSLIKITSAAVGDGYFPAPDPSSLGRGHFFPSDLIQRSERGISLAGRVSDIINVAGRKLNPMEVEARLAGFPGVRQAVVFGVPSALRNEEAIACVAADASFPVADLLRYCHSVLSAWQVPKDVWLVDEIPPNERGKINRRHLARLYAGKRKSEDG